MRRSALFLASAVLVVLVASGVAWAATIDCRAGAEICYGTNGSDTINGSGARAAIDGSAGGGTTLDVRADLIYGGGVGQIGSATGADDVFGNDGDDTLQRRDEDDTMKGGRGNDRARNAPQTLGDDRFYGVPATTPSDDQAFA